MRIPLLALLLPLLVPATAQAEDPPAGHTFLTSAIWSASAYTHHAGGVVCWIEGDDGSLRVEVLRDNDRAAGLAERRKEVAPELDPLLTRSGNGWTLVLGPDGNGTLNPWGREWRKVPAGLAQLVRLVTSSLGIFPDSPPDFPFASSVGPSRRPGAIPCPRVLKSIPSSATAADVWRYQLAPLALEMTEGKETPGFRRELTVRGRGAGGLGEILKLHWFRPGDQEDYGLRIVSSRRSGTLSLDPPRDLVVATPDAEAFLPLWPLSQFFEPR